jgi:2',3'-cyclic-nucleotide 2'-phosphodiesterase (5'-nucleotidase family)
VTSEIAPDESTVLLVADFGKLVAGKKLNSVLGRIKTPLEGRFDVIRTQETNLGNWVADVVRETMRAHVCIINAGLPYLFYLLFYLLFIYFLDFSSSSFSS